jgi:hypothetical protein
VVIAGPLGAGGCVVTDGSLGGGCVVTDGWLGGDDG